MTVKPKCRECGQPIDASEGRFCCDMCEHEFYKRDVVSELYGLSKVRK